MKTFNALSRLLIVLAMLTANHNVLAGTKKNVCVFDFLGSNGPIFSQMKEYQMAALDWGVEMILKPYTNERVATEDFKSGLCDAANLTGTRSRQFNSFTGSLDAIGAMPSYTDLKSVISTISTEKAAKLMINAPYEVVGIFPAGAAYLFVNDHSIDTVGELAGKRIAIMDSDPAQLQMVTFIGASPISSSLTNMYSKFNNGSVDVTYGPAIVYEAMELDKGLEPNGGVIRFSLAQLTTQILIRKDNFPAGFGQKSREYSLSQFDQGVRLANKYENKIQHKRWVTIPDSDKTNYHEVFRQARLKLRDEGIYNTKMLSVMRRVRCKRRPHQAECSAADKE